MLSQDAIFGTHRSKGNPPGLSGWLTPTELCCANSYLTESEYKQSPPLRTEHASPTQSEHSSSNTPQPERFTPPPPFKKNERSTEPESGLIGKILSSLSSNGELLNLLTGLLGKDFRLDAATLMNLFNQDGGSSNLLGALGGLFKKAPQNQNSETVDLKNYKRVD